ncbi:EmrB/QacA subfamily drug resistance transporter [Pullulanibacillus pueri]|uniref:MFS transporter n=1 Tax=Pullulanibacillus pueri TaxID=1437324 RepID=A0A8J2ZWX1_9BACL|nr:MDR family MFS transporter [Pullulanibacillus pueri]MBM7682662.1 EmrB/QacA subfamily drug resistance transporter [Pullulanibacillus pueri]GGH82692.1 MFS transporter [Pullulanibacillus pueri]
MEKDQATNFSIGKILPAVLTIAIGMLLVMMDTTIMNVALPHLQSAFNTDINTAQWSITAYTLALSLIIPMSGWLADRFSAKKAFAGAIILFTISSILCALSTSISELIVFRVIQGLAGGVVGPIGIAMSFRLIPMEKRGSMMAILGLPMLVAPTIGPVLSGWLINIASWHYVFLINIPIGIISIILILKFIPNYSPNKESKLDKLGALLTPFVFPFLIYGINQGAAHGWLETKTLLFLVIGVVALIAFIRVEVKGSHPLLEIKAFKIGEFTKGLLLMWINQIAIFGAMLFVPLYLQNVRGMSAFDSGLMMVPQAIASFIGITIGGRVYDQLGTKFAVIPGFIFSGISLYLFSTVNAHTHYLFIAISVVLLGMGQGLVGMQVNNHALQSAPVKLISRLTPLSNVMLQVVNSLSIATLTAFMTTSVHHYEMKENHNSPSLPSVLHGYHVTFLLLTALIMIGFVFSLFLKRKVA